MKEIVASLGQCGGTIMKLNEENNQWERIGFHTGTHKGMNVGQILTEELFLDFYYPTIEYFIGLYSD